MLTRRLKTNVCSRFKEKMRIKLALLLCLFAWLGAEAQELGEIRDTLSASAVSAERYAKVAPGLYQVSGIKAQ